MVVLVVVVRVEVEEEDVVGERVGAVGDALDCVEVSLCGDKLWTEFRGDCERDLRSEGILGL